MISLFSCTINLAFTFILVDEWCWCMCHSCEFYGGNWRFNKTHLFFGLGNLGFLGKFKCSMIWKWKHSYHDENLCTWYRATQLFHQSWFLAFNVYGSFSICWLVIWSFLQDYMNYRKYRYFRLDGSSTIQDRRDMVKDFQHR